MIDEFKYDVFLSYARPDSSRVRDLAERLRTSGLRVWFDEWCIVPGDDVVLSIERGLEASRTLILCMSNAMFASEWTRLERNTTLFQDPSNVDRRIIPLKLEDCTVPPSINRFAAIDGRVTDNQTISKLLSACRPQSEAVLQTTTEHKLEGPAEAISSSSQFDSRYRFDTFVVGSSNQFCHAAAMAVANSPAVSYNPLFIYGGVGLGKTHLMHAIGHKIRTENPQLKLMYLPAEQFVNELINSIRFDRMPEFRALYRQIDVLMIDDVQFIGNKERTQEEFFHTFNTLYTSQRQIIISSDSSPRRIPHLEERLRSRFEWGLIADVQPPDLETKIAILRRKAELQTMDLPDDVALFIARNVKSNVRELEGLLNRVFAYSSLTGLPANLDLAKATLQELLPSTSTGITIEDITKFIARYYGLKVSEIKSSNNSKHIVFPRQIAMYLCKKLTDLSYAEIGQKFNNKHHSTVMHAIAKIEKLRTQNPEIDRQVQEFIEDFS